MNLNKCPKCDTAVAKVNAEPVEIVFSRTDRYRGFSYACPNCYSVLSIEMNPLTLKDDILSEIQELRQVTQEADPETVVENPQE